MQAGSGGKNDAEVIVLVLQFVSRRFRNSLLLLSSERLRDLRNTAPRYRPETLTKLAQEACREFGSISLVRWLWKILRYQPRKGVAILGEFVSGVKTEQLLLYSNRIESNDRVKSHNYMNVMMRFSLPSGGNSRSHPAGRIDQRAAVRWHAVPNDHADTRMNESDRSTARLRSLQ